MLWLPSSADLFRRGVVEYCCWRRRSGNSRDFVVVVAAGDAPAVAANTSVLRTYRRMEVVHDTRNRTKEMLSETLDCIGDQRRLTVS